MFQKYRLWEGTKHRHQRRGLCASPCLQEARVAHRALLWANGGRKRERVLYRLQQLVGPTPLAVGGSGIAGLGEGVFIVHALFFPLFAKLKEAPHSCVVAATATAPTRLLLVRFVVLVAQRANLHVCRTDAMGPLRLATP